ncbi:DUF5610 domain-containing protein [Oxalobacteraceae bacterium A2-2]
MANPVSATNSSSARAADLAANSAARADGAQDSAPVSATAKAKAQFNAAIVQSSLSVSINSGNEPMSVLLKTALNGINEALKADFGEDAIQNAMSQDNTPEGTAGRIVSLSTAFLGAYKQQNPGMEDGEALNSFMATIKKGVEQGFKEAREVLQGLGVLNGDIASNIDKTYDLVQQGFADFTSAQQDQIKQAAGAGPGQAKAA